jgi:CheY-like chemotaxis protein
MVYGFIQQSRGHVSLASAPGSGTAVTILLPRAQARPAALTEPAARDLAISARAGRKTVVLVEGEKLLRDMLADQLAHLGYAVESTQDGPAALALLRSPGAVDLLLTEMLMANGMTGQQLAEAARALRPGLPVLFMSSYGDVQESGPSDRSILLQKPFTTRALAAAIRAAFASRAA